MIEIAITAGNGATRATELHALALSRQTLCLAATAVWIHGELGDDAGLVARLSASGCEDLDALIAAAEARPRRALTGLGLTLIGAGPADAAALDRFYWAPMGLVRDLAIPPPPPAPVVPPTRVEPLDPDKIRQAATGG